MRNLRGEGRESREKVHDRHDPNFESMPIGNSLRFYGCATRSYDYDRVWSRFGTIICGLFELQFLSHYEIRFF